MIYHELREVELSELDWFRAARPLLEYDHFLLDSGGDNKRLQPVGKEVVLVLEGYQKQQARLQEKYQATTSRHSVQLVDCADPCWASWQALPGREVVGSSHLRCDYGRCGVLPLAGKLGLEEHCRIAAITYHRVVPFGATETEAVQLQHPPRTLHSYQAAPHQVEDIWAAGQQDAAQDAAAASAPRLEGFFVRLTLQRCREKCERMARCRKRAPSLQPLPSFCVMDMHLDGGTGDFIVHRKRFIKAVSRKWVVGEKFGMFYHDDDDMSKVTWYYGRIKALRACDPSDPLNLSPWNRIYVTWEGLGEDEDCWVNAWEICHEKESAHLWEYYEQWGSSLVQQLQEAAADDVEFEQPEEHDGSEDFVPRAHHRGRGRPRGHGAQGHAAAGSEQGTGSPGSADAAGQGRRRVRLHGSGAAAQQRSVRPRLPETMTVNKQLLKNDWNAGYCCRCLDVAPATLIECDGTCLRSFHAHCLEECHRPDAQDPESKPWYCPDCRAGVATCAVCCQQGVAGVDVWKCRMGSCGYYYHTSCLRAIRPHYQCKVAPPAAARSASLSPAADQGPAAADVTASPAGAAATSAEGPAPSVAHAAHPPLTGSSDDVGDFDDEEPLGRRIICPAHYCQSCRRSGNAEHLLRCWLCPRAYHKKKACLPDSALHIDSNRIVCIRCQAAASSILVTTPSISNICSPGQCSSLLHIACNVHPAAIAAPIGAASNIAQLTALNLIAGPPAAPAAEAGAAACAAGPSQAAAAAAAAPALTGATQAPTAGSTDARNALNLAVCAAFKDPWSVSFEALEQLQQEQAGACTGRGASATNPRRRRRRPSLRDATGGVTGSAAGNDRGANAEEPDPEAAGRVAPAAASVVAAAAARAGAAAASPASKRRKRQPVLDGDGLQDQQRQQQEQRQEGQDVMMDCQSLGSPRLSDQHTPQKQRRQRRNLGLQRPAVQPQSDVQKGAERQVQHPCHLRGPELQLQHLQPGQQAGGKQASSTGQHQAATAAAGAASNTANGVSTAVASTSSTPAPALAPATASASRAEPSTALPEGRAPPAAAQAAIARSTAPQLSPLAMLVAAQTAWSEVVMLCSQPVTDAGQAVALACSNAMAIANAACTAADSLETAAARQAAQQAMQAVLQAGAAVMACILKTNLQWLEMALRTAPTAAPAAAPAPGAPSSSSSSSAAAPAPAPAGGNSPAQAVADAAAAASPQQAPADVPAEPQVAKGMCLHGPPRNCLPGLQPATALPGGAQAAEEYTTQTPDKQAHNAQQHAQVTEAQPTPLAAAALSGAQQSAAAAHAGRRPVTSAVARSLEELLCSNADAAHHTAAHHQTAAPEPLLAQRAAGSHAPADLPGHMQHCLVVQSGQGLQQEAGQGANAESLASAVQQLHMHGDQHHLQQEKQQQQPGQQGQLGQLGEQERQGQEQLWQRLQQDKRCQQLQEGAPNDGLPDDALETLLDDLMVDIDDDNSSLSLEPFSSGTPLGLGKGPRQGGIDEGVEVLSKALDTAAAEGSAAAAAAAGGQHEQMDWQPEGAASPQMHEVEGDAGGAAFGGQAGSSGANKADTEDGTSCPGHPTHAPSNSDKPQPNASCAGGTGASGNDSRGEHGSLAAANGAQLGLLHQTQQRACEATSGQRSSTTSADQDVQGGEENLGAADWAQAEHSRECTGGSAGAVCMNGDGAADVQGSVAIVDAPDPMAVDAGDAAVGVRSDGGHSASKATSSDRSDSSSRAGGSRDGCSRSDSGGTDTNSSSSCEEASLGSAVSSGSEPAASEAATAGEATAPAADGPEWQLDAVQSTQLGDAVVQGTQPSTTAAAPCKVPAVLQQVVTAALDAASEGQATTANAAPSHAHAEAAAPVLAVQSAGVAAQRAVDGGPAHSNCSSCSKHRPSKNAGKPSSRAGPRGHAGGSTGTSSAGQNHGVDVAGGTSSHLVGDRAGPTGAAQAHAMAAEKAAVVDFVDLTAEEVEIAQKLQAAASRGVCDLTLVEDDDMEWVDLT